MERMNGENFTPAEKAWDCVKLVISGEVRREMELNLITDDDLKECIWLSVENDDRFVDDGGVYTASMVKRVITYWADYRELGDNAFEVVSAYCHRMKFGGEEGK